jgi:exopolysaccharide biosynthesis operon protein EpsL
MVRRKERGASGRGRRTAGLRLRGIGASIIVAGALAPVTDAAALWDDRLELFVAESVTRDDNVFRISDSVDPAVAVGSSSKGDTYYTTSPGFTFNVPVSRQRFAGGVKWNYTRYNRFTVLDFDGHEGRAAWLWQAGNDLSGQLGYTQTLALASLANSRAGILSGTPNSIETQRAFFSTAYQLTPRWRLQGEVGRLEQINGLPMLTVNDIIIESADLAVSYLTPAKNQIGLGARVEEGRYPNRLGPAANLSSDAYRQHNVDVIADYTITGHSRVRVRAGWVSRSHEQLSQRDFEEGTFNVTYDWQPTGKLALAAIARREISPLDDTYSSFVLLTGVALNPTLRLTEKFSMAATLEYSARDYVNDPSLLLVSSRTDWVRTAGLKASYRPLRSVTLEMSWVRQTRSSTAAFGDYEVTAAGMTARIGF